MSKMSKTLTYTVGVLVLLFLFWNPLTRQVILWLLPLGSGVDDVVFLVLLVFGGTIITVRVIRLHGQVLWEQIKKLRFVWIVIAIIVFAIFACLALGVYPIY